METGDREQSGADPLIPAEVGDGVGEPERPPTPGGLRRLRTRFAIGLVVAGVTAGAVIGLGVVKTGSASIGSGVVVIDTNLANGGGAAAGTGMVLTSSGLVLTNNHVIRDASTIRISVPGTTRSYTATVVGYDVSADVAVLKASGASGLKTAAIGNSSQAAVDQAVTAVGNAGGTGSLTSARGTVTALARAITVNNDEGGTEHLSDLLETNADVQPGDSGGPLYNASGKVIGMDTAASVGAGIQQTSSNDGYAIPINTALRIALQIAGGQTAAGVHLGGTALLGVEVEDQTDYGYGESGAVIVGVEPSTPAADALQTGDLITAVDGHTISSAAQLGTVILDDQPGQDVTITYVDQSDSSHTTSVSLASGPPQ